MSPRLSKRAGALNIQLQAVNFQKKDTLFRTQEAAEMRGNLIFVCVCVCDVDIDIDRYRYTKCT